MRRLVRYLTEHELLGVSVLLLLALTIFFIPALISGGYFAPSDILRIFGPFADGTKAHNSLLSDPVVQFLPWFKLSRELIQNGQLPMWNIYSGGGLPLMANMQSQVFWPFSVFIYLFNFKVGLLLYTAGKLFLTGFFSYLYLREINLRKAIALIGALAFMFVGFNVVWLMWPHTNAVFLLPLGLFLIERYFRTRDARFMLWFSAAIGVSVLGGHPETFFHIIFAVIVYIVYSLFAHRRNWPDFFATGMKWLGAGLLGGGLAALQLVPFAEYLRLSQALFDRTGQINEYFLYKISAVFHFIPDFFGNPGLRDNYYLAGANFNYNETNMAYVGVGLLFLSLYAAIWAWRDRMVKFWLILSVFCVAVIYNLPVVFDLVVKLPVFQAAANHRFALVLGFGIVVMGSIGLQKLLETAPTRKQVSALTVTALAIAASLIWYAHSRGPELMQPGVNIDRMNQWQLIFVGVFGVNFLLVWLILFRAPTKQKLLLFGLLVFAETGLHGAFYNTVSQEKDFYPSSATTDYLSTEFPNGYYKTYTAEGILLPPNLGSWYGFNHVNDNDAVGLKTYGDLKRGIGPLVGGWDTYASPDFDRLAFLGAKYLVYPADQGQRLLDSYPSRLNVGYRDEQVAILTQSAFPRAYFLASATLPELEETLKILPYNYKYVDQFQTAESYRLERDGSETIKITASTDGYLVLNENYYPGWQAIVNGTSVTIESAMGLRAIPVKAGDNQINTSYQPQSFRTGLWITLASLLIWLGSFVVTRKKTKPTS